MVGWWTADSTALDISGWGNHGSAQGGASYGAGAVDSAFVLPAITDYVRVPDPANDSLDFPLSAVTLN
jgi:hypothetical protein